MRKITISLDDEQLIWIKRILVDEDKEGALEFIRKVLERKLKEAELPHCVPVFEASYKPNQAETVTGSKPGLG